MKKSETSVYRLDGTLERVFPSRTDAARFMGILATSMVHYSDGRPVKGVWRLRPDGPTPRHRFPTKPTILYLSDGTVFGTYPSQTEAAKALGVSRSHARPGSIVGRMYGVGEEGLAALRAMVEKRRVPCVNVRTGERACFDCIPDAASSLGISGTSIYRCLIAAKAGRLRVVHGWAFGAMADTVVPAVVAMDPALPVLSERMSAKVSGWAYLAHPKDGSMAWFRDTYGISLPRPGNVWKGLVLHMVHKGISHVWVKPTLNEK